MKFTVPPTSEKGSRRRPAAPYYIQRRGGGHLETVDQFDTRTEARAMLKEYRISDPTANFYISRRACRNWTANANA